jgi:hypothetical protein
VTEEVKRIKDKQSGIPPVLERYEAKYTIPFDLIDPISKFVEPYCFLDAYSEKSPDLFYLINSLYFDTPDYLFLRLRLRKADNRFNMRIRTYGESPVFPWFFEIKHKRGDIMKKYRAKFYNENIELLLNNPEAMANDAKNEKEAKNRLLFHRLVQTYNAEPKMLIQYKRKAYISETEEYARVTFDTTLRSMKQTNYIPLPDESRLQPCDVETAYDYNSSVILELKCYTSFVPLWMLDLIREFQLNRRGFSKYMTGLRQIESQSALYDSSGRSVFFDNYDDEEI